MSGTKSPSRRAPATEVTGRWHVWKLALLFYPFVAAAVAINLFLAGLITNAMGWGSLAPMQALVWSVPLGIPATWLTGRWVRGLMDEADGVADNSKPQ